MGRPRHDDPAAWGFQINHSSCLRARSHRCIQRASRTGACGMLCGTITVGTIGESHTASEAAAAGSSPEAAALKPTAKTETGPSAAAYALLCKHVRHAPQWSRRQMEHRSRGRAGSRQPHWCCCTAGTARYG
jgi:hypothetical protein